MVQIIAGRKGKGKTKHLLDMANNGIKAATGSIVYLDKSSKHMYELNNRDYVFRQLFEACRFRGRRHQRDHYYLRGYQREVQCKLRIKHFHGCSRNAGERTERCSGFSVIHNSYSLQPGRQVLPGCLCDGNCVGFRRAHNSVRNRYQILPGGTGHWQKRKNQRL